MNEFIEKIRKYSDYSCEDGAEDAAVEAAEKALGLTFAEDYREYPVSYTHLTLPTKQVV